MNSILWKEVMLLILFLLGSAFFQGCFAEQAVVEVGNEDTSSDRPILTEETTPKATIAPIHTKEPEVKPPIENPITTPIPPAGTPTQVTYTERPTHTIIQPTQIPNPQIGPGNNETVQTYFEWGKAFEDVGNWQAAIDEYGKAIAKEPYFSDAWYRRAQCYEKLGMSDEAYESYRFLLTINPSYNNSNFENLTSNQTVNISIPTDIKNEQKNGFDEPTFWIILGAILALLILTGFKIWQKKYHTDSIVLRLNKPEPDYKAMIAVIEPYYKGDIEIFTSVMKIAMEIAREGREGSPIGTAFLLGDSKTVMDRSRQLILNPVAGHSEEERSIKNPDIRENIKELALVDGVFVINELGVIEAAGRYITIDTSKVRLPKGLGTRHVSVAAITHETQTLGIVVSESGGIVRIYAKGKMIIETT